MREKGNCYDFAEFMLKRLEAAKVETELINFYDYQITPCQNCSYECVQKFDPREWFCFYNVCTGNMCTCSKYTGGVADYHTLPKSLK